MSSTSDRKSSTDLAPQKLSSVKLTKDLASVQLAQDLDTDKKDGEAAVDIEEISTHSDIVLQENTGWRSLIWDTWGHPDKEHVRIIRKLDLCLLAFATISTFIKYIDKTNLTSAYVSGMQEDLGIHGDELNYANTAYNISSIIMGYPFGFLMARFSTKWLVILVETFWILITFCFSAIKTPLQMIVLRCLLGIFECAHYPALSFILGTYYTPRELARRNVLLQSSTALGSMFANYIQSGTYSHLNGTLGRAGWRWTFIIDGVISIGVLIPQILFFPDILGRLRPNFVWTQKEIDYLISRRPQTRNEKYTFEWSDVKKVFTTWEVWAFWYYGLSQDIVSLTMPAFILWLKAWNTVKPGSYSIPQLNNYNSILYAVQYIVAVLTGWWSDNWGRGKRSPPIVIAGIVSFVVNILLAALPVFPEHRGFRFFLYLNTCWALGTAGLYWAQAQEFFIDDFKLRAITTGGINIYSFTANCIVNPIWYRTSKMPNIRTGHYLSAFFAATYSLTAGLLWVKENQRAKARKNLIQ